MERPRVAGDFGRRGRFAPRTRVCTSSPTSRSGAVWCWRARGGWGGTRCSAVGAARRRRSAS